MKSTGSVHPRKQTRKTPLQRSGKRGENFARKHCCCRQCGKIAWLKSTPRNEPGIDLVCTCAQEVQVKAGHSKIRLVPDMTPRVRRRAPGGNFGVQERLKKQNRSVDLIYAISDDYGNIVARLAAAEDQPDGFITPRAIKSGRRKDYVISDYHLSLIDEAKFPVHAAHYSRVHEEGDLVIGRK